MGVHMQAAEILCPLIEIVWNGWPSRQEAWLISPPNTIVSSPIFSSISAAPFKKGTEFSVGPLTVRLFSENASRTSSSAMFVRPSEDVCNGRERGSLAEKGLECQNCQICLITFNHPMTCFLWLVVVVETFWGGAGRFFLRGGVLHVFQVWTFSVIISVSEGAWLDWILSPCLSTGHLLDSFARSALWDCGLDYLHGTGHGVGSFLNVHEGPCGISYKTFADEPLEAGMIVSDGI